jgi:nucleotide-binding universal stress UspA family protein
LTEQLVRLGHEVTLFASADSITSAELAPCCNRALRLDDTVRDVIPHYMLMVDKVRERADDFDILHFHIDLFHFPLFRVVGGSDPAYWCPLTTPRPMDALRDIRAFVRSVGGLDAILEFMHIGETEPQIIEDEAVVSAKLQTGDLVSAILATAEQADLIAMPTKGHDGLLDVLRGSTTERVVRHAPCPPVLALPVN